MSPTHNAAACRTMRTTLRMRRQTKWSLRDRRVIVRPLAFALEAGDSALIVCSPTSRASRTDVGDRRLARAPELQRALWAKFTQRRECAPTHRLRLVQRLQSLVRCLPHYRWQWRRGIRGRRVPYAFVLRAFSDLCCLHCTLLPPPSATRVTLFPTELSFCGAASPLIV